MKQIILIGFFLVFQLSLLAQNGTFIHVSEIRQGQSLPVSISGTGTQFSRGSNTAVFYKNGSPTADLKMTNIVVGSDVLMGGIVEAATTAQAGTNYSCVIKNLANADVPLNPLQVKQSGSGNGTGKFLVSITPDSIEQGVSIPGYLLISGVNTHFKTTPLPNQLYIYPQGSSIPLSQVSYNLIPLSNTSIRVFIFIGANVPTGQYDIGITNPLDSSLKLSNSLYIGPRGGVRLHQIQPAGGDRNQTLSIGITGIKTKFTQGSHTLSFFRQGSNSTKIRVNSFSPSQGPGDTIMAANITIDQDAQPGLYGVVIASNQYVTYLQESFEVNATPPLQKFVSISPNSSLPGSTLNVNLSGINTSFQMGSNTVQFFYQGSPTSHVSLNNPNSLSNTLIQGTVNISGNAPNGVYSYQVYNSVDPYIQSSNTFQVGGNPELTSLNPNIGRQGQVLQVHITGLRTHFGQGTGTNFIQFMRQGSPTFDIEGYAVAEDNINLSAGIIISNTAATGMYDLKVINATDGILVLPNAFRVNENTGPKLISFTPGFGGQGQSLTVQITGSKTNFTQGSQTLSFFRKGSPTELIQTDNYVISHDSLLSADIHISTFAERGFYSIALNKNWDTMGVTLLYLNEVFEVGFPIGINESAETDQHILVYPNPAEKQFSIVSRSEDILGIELFDLLGRNVYQYTPEIPVKYMQIEPGENIKSGQQLFLRIQTLHGVQIKKLWLQ